jgi:hypothetical protein
MKKRGRGNAQRSPIAKDHRAAGEPEFQPDARDET